VDGGAESPYESLTRLLLVRAGFPRPQTQIPVLDEYGYVIARIDMGWTEWLVGVDFDGAHHWTDPKQRSRDVERYAKLPELGWIDVRLTSGILHNDPRVFLDRVGAALISRGCPKTW
jgi:very-short-patch-repair endonuclease